MRILAIDTSSPQGSVSLQLDSGEILTYHGDDKETYSSRLFRWLSDLQKRIKSEDGFRDLHAVALTCGPGTFTGLRIGMATAKGISLSNGCPVIAFPTLETMAWSPSSETPLRRPLLMAGRGELYTALFRLNGNNLERLEEDQVRKPEDINFHTENEKTLVFGNGCSLVEESLENSGNDNVKLVTDHPVLSRTLITLASARILNTGLTKEDPGDLHIHYVRQATTLK